MFTGIIEETGEIKKIEHGAKSIKLTVAAKAVLDKTKPGDSISTNGVCLTAVHLDSGAFTADVMPETLRRSNLAYLRIGSRVNLERAMPANGRFGGHIVSGHIDGTGTILSLRREGNAVWIKINAPSALLRYIVQKGSIAIDGASLTVAEVTGTDFSVSIIPHTGSETTLLSHRPGSIVNLECDIIGKYVEKLIQPKRESGITMDFLSQNGF